MTPEPDFDRLWRDHADGLFGFVYYRTGDRTLAEDVVADAFERAMRARRRFDLRRGRAKTWVYAIALNCLNDQLRRNGAEERALARVAVGETAGDRDALELVEEREQLLRALQTLSEEEREAVALRYGGDLSLRELAQVCGEPLTTVEGRVYRALRKLRGELL